MYYYFLSFYQRAMGRLAYYGKDKKHSKTEVCGGINYDAFKDKGTNWSVHIILLAYTVWCGQKTKE